MMVCSAVEEYQDNDLLRLRFLFRLWKSFGSGSGSGSRQCLAQFSNNKNFYVQNLAFIFKVHLSFLSFSLNFYSIFLWIRPNPDQEQGPEPEP
jgi:hypothetical protein